MAKFKVFFEQNPSDLVAAEYLKQQEEWQRAILKAFVNELESKGTIDDPDARFVGDQRWSLWVRAEGKEAVNHLCYLADEARDLLTPLAKSLLNSTTPAKESGETPATRQLVIESSVVERDSVGGIHPGYHSIEDYASRLDTVQRPLFLQVIAEIGAGVSSRHYTRLKPDRFNIHIDRPDVGYGVHIHCVAYWL